MKAGKALKMTNAYMVDKPHTWRGYLRDFLVMGGLSIALVFGTHYAIKYEKEIKQYVSSKAEQVEQKIKKSIDDFF